MVRALAEPEDAVPLAGDGQRVSLGGRRRSRRRERYSVSVLETQRYGQTEPRARLYEMKRTLENDI